MYLFSFQYLFYNFYVTKTGLFLGTFLWVFFQFNFRVRGGFRLGYPFVKFLFQIVWRGKLWTIYNLPLDIWCIKYFMKLISIDFMRHQRTQTYACCIFNQYSTSIKLCIGLRTTLAQNQLPKCNENEKFIKIFSQPFTLYYEEKEIFFLAHSPF